VSATELIVARNKRQRNGSELPNVSLNQRTLKPIAAIAPMCSQTLYQKVAIRTERHKHCLK
jgi:hypothetical protein